MWNEAKKPIILLAFANDHDDRVRYGHLPDALALCANGSSCTRCDAMRDLMERSHDAEGRGLVTGRRSTPLIPDFAGREPVKVKGQCRRRVPVC